MDSSRRLPFTQHQTVSNLTPTASAHFSCCSFPSGLWYHLFREVFGSFQSNLGFLAILSDRTAFFPLFYSYARQTFTIWIQIAARTEKSTVANKAKGLALTKLWSWAGRSAWDLTCSCLCYRRMKSRSRPGAYLPRAYRVHIFTILLWDNIKFPNDSDGHLG